MFVVASLLMCCVFFLRGWYVVFFGFVQYDCLRVFVVVCALRVCCCCRGSFFVFGVGWSNLLWCWFGVWVVCVFVYVSSA
mgnify:CR=1 FL=1